MSSKKIAVSVVIKALNEEDNIARTIESALRSIKNIGGEVILADSYSIDRTVEIASRYPIKIVKLSCPEDRCCGVGGQLGYQVARGEFIWIVDGDMELVEGFIEVAISCLLKEPNLAGVGGRIVEKNLESLEYRARLLRAPEHLQAGIVDRLDGGAVYRRIAIEMVSYFTNKNLHAYEEYELAVRLRSCGWFLKRIPNDAVFHFGHKTEAFALLLSRWRNKYAYGIGELLRSAIGKPHFRLVVREINELHLYGIVVFWWIVMFSLFVFGIFTEQTKIVMLIVLLLPFLIMILKKNSIISGLYSVVSWNVYAVGLLRGFFKRQRSPSEKIDCVFLESCCVITEKN